MAARGAFGKPQHISAAIQYVVAEQGEAMAVTKYESQRLSAPL
jgi:hypothetical protein